MPSDQGTHAAAAARGAALSEVAETSRGSVEFARVGEPPYILFFHGSPGGYDQGVSNDDFAGVGFGTIAVSRPGYLRTPLSTGPSMEEQADAMAALLDVLEVDRVVAYGVSGGGPSAIQFAARHPDRTSALLLGCAIAQRYVSSTLPGWAMRVLLSDPFIRLQDWAMARFPRAGIAASPELVTRAPFYLKSREGGAGADFVDKHAEVRIRILRGNRVSARGAIGGRRRAAESRTRIVPRRAAARARMQS